MPEPSRIGRDLSDLDLGMIQRAETAGPRRCLEQVAKVNGLPNAAAPELHTASPELD